MDFFRAPEPKTEVTPPEASPRRDIPTWIEGIWPLAAVPLLIFFIVPVVSLFLRVSPDHLFNSLFEKSVLQAVAVSFRTTLASLVVIVVLGTPLAYLLGRHRFPLKRVVDTLIDLPTVLPPSVAGVALLLTFGRQGLLGDLMGQLGIHIAFSPAAVVLAQTFIAAPYYIRAAALGFAGVDSEIIQAAQLDGANRWQIFRFIVLPISRLALISGGMMSWARALGEFGATIIFAGNFPGKTQTMPLAIYLGFERDLDVALTLSVILVGVSFLSILFVKQMVDRH